MTDPTRTALSQPEPASLSDEKIEAIFDKHGQHVYSSEDDMGAKVIFWSDFKTAAREIESASPVAAPHQPVQPEPGEVQKLVKWLHEKGDDYDCIGETFASLKYRRIADLLAQRHPQPVPVSERPWEREGWCDEQGRCWALNEHLPAWEFHDCADSRKWADLFLPAHALPLPGEVEHG